MPRLFGREPAERRAAPAADSVSLLGGMREAVRGGAARQEARGPARQSFDPAMLAFLAEALAIRVQPAFRS